MPASADEIRETLEEGIAIVEQGWGPKEDPEGCRW